MPHRPITEHARQSGLAVLRRVLRRKYPGKDVVFGPVDEALMERARREVPRLREEVQTNLADLRRMID